MRRLRHNHPDTPQLLRAAAILRVFHVISYERFVCHYNPAELRLGLLLFDCAFVDQGTNFLVAAVYGRFADLSSH